MIKKTTLQQAEMLVDNVIDENLKKRYGTSVNEYMTREHAKDIRNQINELREEFKKIGKSKTSTLSFEELHDFLNKINVNLITSYNILNYFIL
jgi:succinate dehydrogenase/fumarate reductase flavoprotein subunit